MQSKKTKLRIQQKEELRKLTGLVLQVDNNTEIYADVYNYIVKRGGVEQSFHATLLSAIEEVSAMMQKEMLVNATQHKFEDVIIALAKTQTFLENLFTQYVSQERKENFKVHDVPKM